MICESCPKEMWGHRVWAGGISPDSVSKDSSWALPRSKAEVQVLVSRVEVETEKSTRQDGDLGARGSGAQMPKTFRLYLPDQILLLPASPRDWLLENHLGCFISETGDRPDLKAFNRRYKGAGRRNQLFEPRMMVGVLFYGYVTGTFSSRKPAKYLEGEWRIWSWSETFRPAGDAVRKSSRGSSERESPPS